MTGSNIGKPRYNTATNKKDFLNLCSHVELVLLYRQFINKDIEDYRKETLISALNESTTILEEFWDFLDEEIYFYKTIEEGKIMRRDGDNIFYVLDLTMKEIRYKYETHGWIKV